MAALIDKIYKKKDGVNYHNKAKKVQITFQQLSEINKENILKTQLIQISLDEDRVNEICKTWRKKTGFILTERPIVIGVLEDDDKCEYYLVDGQHKFNAGVKLCEQHDMNEHLDCVFIRIDTDKELDNLFRLINMDSKKNELVITLDFFQRKLAKELKQLIKEKYKKCYAGKSTSKNHLMTIDEFINEISSGGIFDGWDNGLPSINLLMEKLEKANDCYFKKVCYLENLENKEMFYADEIDVLNDYKNCMFMKNNNFREFFLNSLYTNKKNNIIPTHKYHKGKRIA